MIDQQRLVSDGILSVFVQEGSGNFGVTTSDLHVLDFDVTVTASILLGDVNLDGRVNFLDISPFISRLSIGTFQVEADIDENGSVNFLDISPFIFLLSQ